MEKVFIDNKVTTEDICDDIRKTEIYKDELLSEQRKYKREETYKKFQELKKLVNENVQIQETIKKIMKESKFNVKDTKKFNYVYYVLSGSIVLVDAVIICMYNVMKMNIDLFNLFLYLAAGTILISCFTFNITKSMIRKRVYKKYLRSCKKSNINNENTIKSIEVLLDNNLRIRKLMPISYFKYFTKEYGQSSIDDFIAFLCRNNNLILKKCRNRGLSIYKNIYSRNMDLLLDIEEIENNYFLSNLRGTLYDSIDECVEKFLNLRG